MSGKFILGHGKLTFWRKVRENLNCKTDLIPLKIGRNISGQMGAMDCCKWTLEATTISDILHLFGQGNLPFISEKSGDFENWCLWQPCYSPKKWPWTRGHCVQSPPVWIPWQPWKTFFGLYFTTAWTATHCSGLIFISLMSLLHQRFRDFRWVTKWLYTYWVGGSEKEIFG